MSAERVIEFRYKVAPRNSTTIARTASSLSVYIYTYIYIFYVNMYSLYTRTKFWNVSCLIEEQILASDIARPGGIGGRMW